MPKIPDMSRDAVIARMLKNTPKPHAEMKEKGSLSPRKPGKSTKAAWKKHDAKSSSLSKEKAR